MGLFSVLETPPFRYTADHFTTKLPFFQCVCVLFCSAKITLPAIYYHQHLILYLQQAGSKAIFLSNLAVMNTPRFTSSQGGFLSRAVISETNADLWDIVKVGQQPKFQKSGKNAPIVLTLAARSLSLYAVCCITYLHLSVSLLRSLFLEVVCTHCKVMHCCWTYYISAV